MNRRDFLLSGSTTAMALAVPVTGKNQNTQPGAADPRTYVVTTKVEIHNHSGKTRVWLPAPIAENIPFQRTIKSGFSAEGGRVRLVRKSADDMGMVFAEFPAGIKPVLIQTSTVETQNYSVDLSRQGRQQKEPSNLDYFLRPTKLMPTDGIVRSTATEITSGLATDLDKARAIYDWIVDHTVRDPKTRGCGRGDIRFMLESEDLRGKCADLNSLYVGLARAAGLPARDVYGIRTGKSGFALKSLGTSSANITKAQHCRAEVHIKGYGWVPVDPADVRKVILEEPPGNLSLNDDIVKRARKRLFGSWEMNWIAYNFANDVQLPGSAGAPLGFLMYPQAETSEGRLDSLDPEDFHYEITSTEI